MNGAKATGVNADGTIVVGNASYGAILWRDGHEPLNVTAYLTSSGIDLHGAATFFANAISADGETIVGYFLRNPSNGEHAFALRLNLPLPCDPDVNHDGNVDQGDIDYLINIIAGADNPAGVHRDFNRDGNADQGDIDALINVVAGGPCP
ncbi:MAG: dockerin type I domain-containing protein [Phycisphaerales bacterium]